MPLSWSYAKMTFMRAPYKLLTILFAFVVALPPHWCQAVPGAPFACCPACAEDDCHDYDSSEPSELPKQECQCGNLPTKQAEQVAIEVAPVSAAFIFDANDYSVGLVCVIDVLQRDFQQTLCCWRK